MEDREKVRQRIIRGLKAAGAPLTHCPVCKQNEWIMATSKAGAYLTTPIGEGGRHLTEEVIDHYMLFCNNCGFSRLHVAKIIDERAAARGVAALVDEDAGGNVRGGSNVE